MTNALEFVKTILFWHSYFFYNFISHDFIFRPVVSEMCFFKLSINSLSISYQMFDVACYPWRVIRFDSYNFVRNRFVCCVKYNFWNVLYILIDIVISLDLKKEASFGQFFSVFIIICQFEIPIIVNEHDQEIPQPQTADNPFGTTRKSRSTIARHQEDKLSKATSSLFPTKMIAILEWT